MLKRNTLHLSMKCLHYLLYVIKGIKTFKIIFITLRNIHTIQMGGKTNLLLCVKCLPRGFFIDKYLDYVMHDNFCLFLIKINSLRQTLIKITKSLIQNRAVRGVHDASVLSARFQLQ